MADRLGHKDAMVTSTVYAHVLAEKDPKTIAVAKSRKVFLLATIPPTRRS